MRRNPPVPDGVCIESIPKVEAAYSDIFYWIEVVTVAVFTVEYFLRIWCTVDAKKYRNSDMGSI
ncbi:MAG: hypothetical protein IIB77_07620 [Proteobacteria bacterium]|nr:hypothetical protein [Pseudomonadota bacterium]